MKTREIRNLSKKYDADTCQSILISAYIYANVGVDNLKSLELIRVINDCKEHCIDFEEIPNLGINSIYELVSSLELIIPKEDQKVNGAFFTPKYIVSYILNQLCPNSNDICLDPSCGSGAFIIGIIDYLKDKYNKTVKKIVNENLYGIDILGYNVHRTKLVVMAYAASFKEVIDYNSINIYHSNSLTFKHKLKYDIVVGNPPYVKLQDIPNSDRFDLKRFTAISSGAFNLYFAFFELAYELLSDSGKMGYITPNNYFTSLSGKSLRTWFGNNKCIYKVIDFGSTKVFDAQTYTCITLINREANDNILYDRINSTTNVESFLKNNSVDKVPVSSLKAKKWRLLKESDRISIDKIENNGTPLSHIFDISVGIATLKDSLYFVNTINQDKQDNYSIELENCTFEIEKSITRPLIKISDFKSDSDLANNSRRIIFPYKCIKGKMIPYSSEEMKKLYPLTLSYLEYVKDKLQNRDKGKKIYSPFYQYGRSQGLNRTGLKFVTPTFSKRPRFLEVGDSSSLFTNGYGLFKKSANIKLFDNHPLSQNKNSDVTKKILNSSTMDFYVRKTSVSIAGGYPCYQKNFIEKFSIPEITNEEIRLLRSINNNKDIDEFVESLYGLNVLSGNLAV